LRVLDIYNFFDLHFLLKQAVSFLTNPGKLLLDPLEHSQVFLDFLREFFVFRA
jgi:hypothetical protein